MTDDFEELLTAVAVSFRLCPDRRRAMALLESALINLTAGEHHARVIDHRRVDALGAPINPRADWDQLRAAVKEAIAEDGLDVVARRYGSGENTLLDIITRKQRPGLARTARLLAVVGGTEFRR